MSDLFAMGKTLYDLGSKLLTSHKEKEEAERMQAITEELRLRILTAGGNCIRPTIASEEDRFLSKMVAKGLLVRDDRMGGYGLPGSFRRSGGMY
jgi:hypothetical protein